MHVSVCVRERERTRLKTQWSHGLILAADWLVCHMNEPKRKGFSPNFQIHMCSHGNRHACICELSAYEPIYTCRLLHIYYGLNTRSVRQLQMSQNLYLSRWMGYTITHTHWWFNEIATSETEKIAHAYVLHKISNLRYGDWGRLVNDQKCIICINCGIYTIYFTSGHLIRESAPELFCQLKMHTECKSISICTI